MRRLLACIAVVVVGFGAVVVARRTRPDVVEAAAGARSAPSPSRSPVATTAVAPAVDLPVLSEHPAPPLTPASGWLNTDPLGPEQLAGKVVLYDFWTFACINCQHTFPWVEAWHERYAADGLVIASVHTPEFDYEGKPDNVAEAVRKSGLTYPVALDPDRKIWRSFENHWWPAFYLYDRDGRYRYQHLGEGSYKQTEDAIRALLGVSPSSPRATPTKS
jgi:thiol-disulfide isomerase/thioredoxin